MAAVNESATAHTPRRRRRLLWPRFESQQNVDLYLRTTRYITLAYVLFGLAGTGLLIWLWLGWAPDGPAIATVSVSTAFVLGLAASLLPRRRSRVLALLIFVFAGCAVIYTVALQMSVVSTLSGAVLWGFLAVIGIGSLRGTWRWHADRGSRVHWGNTAIAVAVPTLAATTITLMLLIVILILEAMSLIPVDAEGDTAAVALATAWLLTWTALAVALTWHLPTVYSGRGASG